MRTLVVTGGSRGIGAACARLAARRGWAVCLSYRHDAAAADAVVAGITQQGGRALAIAGDVAEETAIERLFDSATAAFGPVAGLVNNAGTLAPASAFGDIALDRWERLLATNLTGSFLAARAAVRRMARSRGGEGGAIVNLSSMAALLGGADGHVDYAATKGAIDAMTIGLAREVAGDGIRVNAVRPGLIDTDIHAAGGDPDRPARLAASVPMARTGSADEVAEAAVWLLSDAASYCTGTTITVSGGR